MGDFIIPPAAGLRVGPGSTAISHVVLEIHYVRIAERQVHPKAASTHTLLRALC
jgi:hypothetical protein